MELHEAIRRRSMVRSFSSEPGRPEVVDGILRAALRSPTAGQHRRDGLGRARGARTDGGATSTPRPTTGWRADHPGWNEGLRRAPVVLLAYTSPAAYVARYAEADKAASGLGAGQRRLARALLVRRRRLRRHGGAARPRSTPASGAASWGRSGGRTELAGRLGVPERMAALLRRRARPPRRPRPPLGLAGPAAAARRDRIHRGAGDRGGPVTGLSGDGDLRRSMPEVEPWSAEHPGEPDDARDLQPPAGRPFPHMNSRSPTWP